MIYSLSQTFFSRASSSERIYSLRVTCGSDPASSRRVAFRRGRADNERRQAVTRDKVL